MPKIAKMNVTQIMKWVIACTIPAMAFLTYWQGVGFLVNLGVALVSAMIFEYLSLRARAEKPSRDYSAVVTAILFAAAIPAFASFWTIIIGMFFAIVIAKHLYGGLGHNIFNPAMVGYAVVLIAFPDQMVVWPSWALDSMSAATPLDHANTSLIDHDLMPYFILNGLWLLGGLILLFKRIITWHIPLGYLLGMMVAGVFFPHPVIQLGLGATMIGAFFIATDPVTAPASINMRFSYGLLIGVLIIMMRQFSNYPDGLAFAILLANLCAPFMDQISIRKST